MKRKYDAIELEKFVRSMPEFYNSKQKATFQTWMQHIIGILFLRDEGNSQAKREIEEKLEKGSKIRDTV